MTLYFSLAAFKKSLLIFNFCHFNYGMSRCESFEFMLLGILSDFWTWISVSFPRLGKFSAIILPSKLSAIFLLSFWDPYNANVAGRRVCWSQCLVWVGGTCWRGLGRPARGPDTFQSASFVLRLGGSKSVGVHFKNGVSVSYSPLTLPVVSPAGLRSIKVACLPDARPQGLGAQCGAQAACSSGRTSEFVMSLSYFGSPAGGVGPG